MIIDACQIAACAALNRVRGAKADVPILRDLPGRALWYVAPLYGLLAMASQTWFAAAVLAIAFLAFNCLPSGRWQNLGRLPREASGAPSAIEQWIERACGGDLECLFARHCFGAVAFIAASAVAGNMAMLVASALLPFVVTAAYVCGWWCADRLNWPAVMVAEIIAGAAFGIVIAA